MLTENCSPHWIVLQTLPEIGGFATGEIVILTCIIEIEERLPSIKRIIFLEMAVKMRDSIVVYQSIGDAGGLVFPPIVISLQPVPCARILS